MPIINLVEVMGFVLIFSFQVMCPLGWGEHRSLGILADFDALAKFAIGVLRIIRLQNHAVI